MIDREVMVRGLLVAVLLIGGSRVHGSIAWLAAAPFIALQDVAWGKRRAASLGAVFGLTTGLVAYMPWLAETAQAYFAMPALLAWSGSALLVAPIGMLQGATLALGLHLALRRGSAPAVLAAGAVWATWDWGTLQVFPYYPWASLAAAQVDLTPALRSVALLGQVGLTALTAVGGLAIGAAISDARQRRQWVIVAVGAAVTVVASGLAAPSPETAPALCSLETIDAGLEGPAASAAAHLEPSRARARAWQSPPSALVWPESSLSASPEIDASLRRELAGLAGDTGTVLIAGGPRTRWDANWQAHELNSAFRIDAAGRFEAYDKRWLVPFAEYWPLAPLPVPSFLATDFVVAGDQPRLFAAAGCKLGVLVCFEEQRPELARELALLGADALVVLSNDAHLPAQAASIEMAQARLRAAETGLPVVRAANRGTSAWILSSGAVAARGGDFRAEIARAHAAPAVQLGPFWLAACALVTGALVIGGALRR